MGLFARRSSASVLIGVGPQSSAQGDRLCVRVVTLKEGSRDGDARYTGGDQCGDLSRTDAPLSKDRKASRGGNLDRGDSKWGPGRGLGERWVDRRQVDVVGSGSMGLHRFVGGMGRDTDERFLSKQCTGFCKGQRIEAEMNARSTRGQRDVDPSVDDDFNFRTDPPGDRVNLLGKGEPSLAV